MSQICPISPLTVNRQGELLHIVKTRPTIVVLDGLGGHNN